MNEISMYEAYKKKLQGICDEHDLVFRLRHDEYPITLKISPTGGLDGQMDLLAKAEEGQSCTSPDASIVLAFKDGGIDTTVRGTFVINNKLDVKIKRLFINLCLAWTQFFFRDLMEGHKLNAKLVPVIDDGDDDELYQLPEGAEPLEEIEDIDDILDDGDLPDVMLDVKDSEVEQAAQLVRAMNKASSSMLQREMGISAAAAVQLMDTLEEMGVVSPVTDAGFRTVLPVDEPEV